MAIGPFIEFIPRNLFLRLHLCTNADFAHVS